MTRQSRRRGTADEATALDAATIAFVESLADYCALQAFRSDIEAANNSAALPEIRQTTPCDQPVLLEHSK